VYIYISTQLSIYSFIYLFINVFFHSLIHSVFLPFIHALVQSFSLSFVLSFILPYHSSHTPLFDYSDVLPKLPDLQFPSYVSDSVTYVDEMKSPRFIKTHLPWELLPKQIRDGSKQPKVICDA
jgi:Sulfotransferase domain.